MIQIMALVMLGFWVGASLAIEKEQIFLGMIICLLSIFGGVIALMIFKKKNPEIFI